MIFHRLVGLIIVVLFSMLVFGPASWLPNLHTATKAVFGFELYTGKAIHGIMLAYGLPYLGSLFLMFPKVSARYLAPQTGSVHSTLFTPGIFVVFGYICLLAGAIVLYAFG